MRWRSVMMGVVLFSATLSAQDDKKFESKAGRYKAAFPGLPAISSKKVDDGELNIASVAKSGGGFVVIYTDLSGDKLKEAKPKELLISGEKGLVESFKAKITSSKDIEFGKQKFPAREITAEAFIPEESVSINLRMTIILAESRLYQVFVFGPKDLPKGKEADAFFDTFEIAK
jgi:hypothetical protein